MKFEVDLTSLNNGINSYNAKEYEDAIIHFTLSALQNPLYEYMAIKHRGFSYYHLSENEKALEDLNYVEEHDKNDANLYSYRGAINNNLGNFNIAITDFKRSIEINPEKGFPYFQLGLLHKKLKNYNEALAVLNSLIKLSPNLEAHVVKGNIFEEMGDGISAMVQYGKCIDLEPQSYRGYQQLAFYLFDNKNYDLALIQFTSCVNLCPNGMFYYQRGLCNKEVGNIDDYIIDMNISKDLGFEKANLEIIGNPEKFEIMEKKLILFCETETTGLPKNWKASTSNLENWPRLVQLAWRIYDENGNFIEADNVIIKPKSYIIPLESSAIHGITHERAILEGKKIATVLKKFKKQLNRVDLIVAHNMSFDKKVVGSEFLRHSNKNPLKKIDKYCTMERSTNICKIPGNFGFKWPRLDELHMFLFKEEIEESHNAAIDIQFTSKCYWEMINRKLI